MPCAGCPRAGWASRRARPNPVTTVTYTFVHADWFHLLGNLWFLFLTGPFIEDLYGRPLFAVLYVLSGVAGAGAFAAGSGSGDAVLVGASGAIAGVMGAFLVRLAARRIELLVLPILIIPTFRFTLKLPAFVVIPVWAAEQFYYASVAGAESNVAFSAHIGGLLLGLVFALGVMLLGVEERFVNPAIERQISIEQDPAVTSAADARVAGDLATARRFVDGALRADPGNIDAWTESWELALAARDAERAGQAGLRLIELYAKSADPDMLWGIVQDPRWRELRMPSLFLSRWPRHVRPGRRARARSTGASGARRRRRRLAERPLARPAESSLMRAGDGRAARLVFERARSHSRGWSVSSGRCASARARQPLVADEKDGDGAQ